MRSIAHLIRIIIRFLIVWFIDTISLLVTAWVISGINIIPVGGTSVFVVATAAALVLGLVNLLVRPLILLLAMPLGWMIIFLVGFIINALTLMITSWLMPGLEVNGLWAAWISTIPNPFIPTWFCARRLARQLRWMRTLVAAW
jgi:putative membrane protein